LLHGCRFTWNFLLAIVSFYVIGVDFLRHFQLMVDPAANMLLDKASLQSFATVSSLTTASSSLPAVAEDPAALPTAKAVNKRRQGTTGIAEFCCVRPGPKY
jgi:hypothetical protein